GPKPELRDSVTVYIDPHQSGGANAIERDLRRLAGVDSVTVLLEEKIAYIRVDDENFDPKQLERIDGVASSSR
ncbi:MAG: heavy-metal-associated domain-containing protein, partial [Proteobacteria bacterium]|nr:heavy-metal-associated domain-containing protein [Pseudomonadota bacterium]